MIVHHTADVHRLAQISVAEPVVKGFQCTSVSGVDIDAVAVFVAVVQTGQCRVKGWGNFAAVEDREGGLGQHLSCSPEADIAFTEEVVLEVRAKGELVAGASAERPEKVGQLVDGLLSLDRVSVLGVAANLLVEPVG